MTRYALAAVSLAVLALAPAARAGVIINDTFGDGDLAKNGGVNTWYTGTWRGSIKEDLTGGRSEFVNQTTGAWANGGILAQTVTPLWNEEGATFRWVTGRTSVTSADGHTYQRELGVLKSTHTNTGYAIPWHNSGGGVYVHLVEQRGTAPTDLSVTGSIIVCTDEKKGGAAGAPQRTIASFSLDGYDAQGWLTTELFLDDAGLEVAFSLDRAAYPGFGVTWSALDPGASASGARMTMSWADFNALAGLEGTMNASVFSAGGRVAALVSNGDGDRGVGSWDLVMAETGYTVAPEPATLLLVAAGAGLVGLRRRR